MKQNGADVVSCWAAERTAVPKLERSERHAEVSLKEPEHEVKRDGHAT